MIVIIVIIIFTGWAQEAERTVELSGFTAAAQDGLHLSNPQTIPCCYSITRPASLSVCFRLLVSTDPAPARFIWAPDLLPQAHGFTQTCYPSLIFLKMIRRFVFESSVRSPLKQHLKERKQEFNVTSFCQDSALNAPTPVCRCLIYSCFSLNWCQFDVTSLTVIQCLICSSL